MLATIDDPQLQAWHDAWEPPNAQTICGWAADNIDLPLGGYAIPGNFHIEKSRHLIALLEALEDDRRRMINALKATQTGGSMVSDIFVPWTLDNAPGPIMWNWHTDLMASQHAETRAMPVIRNCRRLERLMPEDRSAKRKQEIVFKNGVPLYIQGPATGNLQGKSIRYLINDEVWQWRPGRLREALARVTQYKKIGTSKVLNISQGGTVGDDWHKLTLDGDLFEWEVACPHCNHFQILCMEEKIQGENGESDKKVYRMKWDDNGENIFYECAQCLKPIHDSDTQRAGFNATGRYRQTRVGKDRETVTFSWSSLIWLPWKDLVKEYRECLAAKKVGALLPLKAFLQKVMAKFWDEKEQIEVSNLQIRYLGYMPEENPQPAKPAEGQQIRPGAPLIWADGFEERFRFLTVDCQADFLEFWAVVRAWGGGQSRRLWRGKLDSWEAIRGVQLKWNVKSQFVAVDSGFRGSEVYRQCCRHVDETGRGWIAFKGSPSETFIHTFPPQPGRAPRPNEKRVYSERTYGDPMLGFKNRDSEKWLSTVSPHALALYQKGNFKCPLYLWSNPSVKDITANLRDGKGIPWFAPLEERYDQGENIYKAQMGSEPKILERDARGNEKWSYHQVGDNHYWDCENEQTVCAIMAGEIPLPTVAT